MFEPKIIGFLCSWCSYTGADLAGTARLKSPWNFKAVRVPCSGRVSPELVMRAFDQGADGVLILGCHIGECHYDNGNHRAAKRIPILHSLMTFSGLEPERLQLDWVSASESERFSRLVSEFTHQVRALGPVHWHVNRNEWTAPTEEERLILRDLEQIGEDWANQDRINRIQDGLRKTAANLLGGGSVEMVIGYEMGSHGRTRPAFIYRPEEADRLVWNQSCTHNLATYLQDILRPGKGKNPPRKIGVVVKPCDSKTINVFISENHIKREQVHLIGVVCDGIHQGAGFGKESESYQLRCLQCAERVPILYDTLVGDPQSIQVSAVPPDLTREWINKIESLPAAERMAFWLSQFDRCIRCYACRQVCPMCSCPTCLYERDDSLWVGMNIEINQKRTFHLGRAYHLAGRCVGCNECERVCPMDIPISLLNQKIAKEMFTEFGFEAGREPAPSPIHTILSIEAG